jgi:hypothetical protein
MGLFGFEKKKTDEELYQEALDAYDGGDLCKKSGNDESANAFYEKADEIAKELA